MKGKYDSPDRFRQLIIDRIKIVAGLYTEVRILLHRVRGCQSLQFKSASEVVYQVGLEDATLLTKIAAKLGEHQINGFAFTDISIPEPEKTSGRPVGLCLEVDEVRGMTDSQMFFQLVEEALMSLHYTLTYGWSKVGSGGGSASECVSGPCVQG